MLFVTTAAGGSHGGDEGVCRGALGAGVGCSVGGGPNEAEMIAGWAGSGPDTVDIFGNEILVLQISGDAVEAAQIADKNSFELSSIGSAIWFAWLMKDSVPVHQSGV